MIAFNVFSFTKEDNFFRESTITFDRATPIKTCQGPTTTAFLGITQTDTPKNAFIDNNLLVVSKRVSVRLRTLEL